MASTITARPFRMIRFIHEDQILTHQEIRCGQQFTSLYNYRRENFPKTNKQVAVTHREMATGSELNVVSELILSNNFTVKCNSLLDYTTYMSYPTFL
jgi:hypothetical protein